MSNIKCLLLVRFSMLSSILLFSCNNEEKNDRAMLSDTTTKRSETGDSTSQMADTSLAVNYLLFKKYLPISIPGFKTVGYPDTADRFTGEPTGETGSNFTSGGKLSFIKHLYQQGEREVAVEIIDYKSAPTTFQGLYKMFDMGHLKQTEEQKVAFVETGVTGVKAKQFYVKEDKSTTIRVFVCDRFIINIQEVNAGPLDASNTLKAIDLRQLMADYCTQHN